MKKYKIAGDQIKSLAEGHGSCPASDRVHVDGAFVGYMYRKAPDGPHDSGWRFVAGDESDGYTRDPTNFGICDVNTVANYAPAIIPLMTAPIGSAFERSAPNAPFKVLA